MTTDSPSEISPLFGVSVSLPLSFEKKNIINVYGANNDKQTLEIVLEIKLRGNFTLFRQKNEKEISSK